MARADQVTCRPGDASDPQHVQTRRRASGYPGSSGPGVFAVHAAVQTKSQCGPRLLCPNQTK